MTDEADRNAARKAAMQTLKAEREALEWAAAEVDDDLSKGGDDL